MTDQIVETYRQTLNKFGIATEILEHPNLKAIADVLKHLELTFSDCMPTLVMKADDTFVAIAIRGDCRADFKKIKKYLGVSDLRMATPEEFTKLTGLPIGAARVYIPGTKVLLDKKIFEKEFLASGSGNFDCSLKYKTEELKNLPDNEIVEIT